MTSIKIGKHLFGFRFVHRKFEGKQMIGYTNRCIDGKYIVFLDYDDMEWDWVADELKRLQDDFELSDFWIFKSSGISYHAVCFDKVTLKEYILILKNSSCDINYQGVPLKYGQKIWTLRLTAKEENIKFLGSVSSAHSLREQSTAHAMICSLLFDSPFEKKLVNPDKKKEICLARYEI